MATLQIDPIADLLEQSNEGGQFFEGPKRRDRQLMYWKKCDIPHCERHINDKGYIILGPVRNRFTIPEVYDFANGKHATELSLDYILPDPKRPKLHIMDELTINNGKFWWVPLVRNGGLSEMPVQQMVDLGWHRNPKFVAAVPALAAYLDRDIPCDYGCPTQGREARIFNSLENYEQHVAVMHKDVAAPRAIGNIIKNGMTATSPELIEILKQLTAQKGNN